MNKYHIILILLFIIAFSISCVGIKDCYHPEEDNFYNKFNLRGPDSYYNMKMCKYQLAGNYEFYDLDLAYPYGHTSRPLLFTAITTNIAMITHGISGMSIPDALGWTMLLIPCLFGALLVFPVYGIANQIFNKKIAFLSSVFVVTTPLLYNASHGSLAGLFDHDSFLMFMTVLFYYFFIKLLVANKTKSFVFYSILSAVPLSIIYMTWVAHEYIFVSIGIFVFILLLYSIFDKDKTEYKVSFSLLKISFVLSIAFLMSLVYAIMFDQISNIIFYSAFASSVLFLVYLWMDIEKRSKLYQFGFISFISVVVLIILYLVRDSTDTFLNPLIAMSNYIFGTGIYSTKIMSTIQEAQLVTLSSLMMGFGFVLFIIAILGFILYLHKNYRDNAKPKDLFFITMFIITMYFSTEAGRFAKDLIPFIAIFGAVFLYAFLKDINIKKLKELRVKQLMACTLVFLVFASGIFITTENVTSENLFNEDKWSEICVDMSGQLNGKPILAWWDYGFYITSITDDPVVADNFQNGIYVTCNFFTSQSEKEALNVLSLYLIKAEQKIYGKLYQPTIDVINKHLRVYKCSSCKEKGGYSYKNANNFILAVENSTHRNDLYENALPYLSKKTVQEAYEIFKEIQVSTGFYIEYVVVDEREITEIKVILPYLADKSTVGFDTYKDEWFEYTANGIENKEMFNNSFIMQLYEEKELMFFEKIYEKEKVKIWRISE